MDLILEQESTFMKLLSLNKRTPDMRVLLFYLSQ